MFGSIPEALVHLGFTPYFHRQFLELINEHPELAGLTPERVASEQRGRYQLIGAAGTRPAVLAGRLSASEANTLRPCVGDFVLASGDATLARIEHVLERASVFRRKSVGASTEAQAIAANVDLAIVVCALVTDHADARTLERGINPRRIERYLRAASEAPARPLVVISKADLRADAEHHAARLRAEIGLEPLLVSALSGAGLAELAACIEPSTTAVVVGSSGAGKSSLVNRLLGREAQAVGEWREDDARGRHTTTGRELFTLPNGALLIDTPGMRELALFADQDTDLARTGFEEIDRHAGSCHFRDCRHESEPGCAVRAALTAGTISEARLEHAHKLRREMAWQQRRHDLQQRRLEKRSARRSRAAPEADED